MEEQAIRGVPWTVLTYLANKVFTVATLIVLTRLLSPSDFGVMAIANLAIIFFGYFSNFGLQAALVLRPDMGRRAEGTILALMLAAGGLVGTAVAALSPVVADIFNEPKLTGILAVMASVLAFGGPRWFYESLMQRELRFSARFGAQIASSLATAGASIGLAIAGAGVWSLAGGFVAGALVHTVALIKLAPYRLALSFDRAAARDAVRVGRGFVAQGGLAFVEDNIDYMTIGKLLGSTQLGFYSMAYRFSELPYWGIADPVARVTFPSFARMRSVGEDISGSFLSSLRLVALVTCPLGIVLSAAAEPLTRTLLGPKWLPMVGVLTILGVWAMVRPTNSTLAWLLNSIGEAGLLAKISAVSIVPLVPAVIIAANAVGTNAVAWVVLSHVTLTALALAFYGSRRAEIPLSRYWDALKPALLATPGGWLVARLVANAGGDWPSILALAAAVTGGFATFALVVTLVEPGSLGRAARQIGRTLGVGARGEGEASAGRMYDVRRS